MKLSKKFKFRDQEYSELNLSLDDLTGQDLIDVEEDLKRRGFTVNAWEYSRTFLIAVAARALKIPAEALKNLPAKDFTSMINQTLSFLAGSDSETAIPANSEK